MDPIVRTALSLLTWWFQKIFGPVFTSNGWRAVALSMSPPPNNIVNVIMRECGDWDNPALLSPTGRHRVRSRAKRQARRQLQNNPYVPLAREHLLKWRRELENAGYTGDPARIGKLRDTEAQINERFEDLLQSDNLPEELRPIVKGNPDAANLLWEFALYGGEAGSKPKLKRNSQIWNLLGLKPEQFKSVPPEDEFPLFLSRL